MAQNTVFIFVNESFTGSGGPEFKALYLKKKICVLKSSSHDNCGGCLVCTSLYCFFFFFLQEKTDIEGTLFVYAR